MAKIVFHAYSAYVGTIINRTICSFWTDDPASPAIDWDPAKQIKIDLSFNLKNARANGGQIDIDDHMIDGGLTTIGPMFPGGTMIGAAWLTDDFVDKRCKLKPTLPSHCYPYELKAIAFVGDPTYGNRRFQGFKAKILGTQTTGSSILSNVELWTAGTGRSGHAVGTYWLDLATISLPDAESGEVGPKGAVDGALFLDMTQRNAYGPMVAAAISSGHGGGGGGGGGGMVLFGGGSGPKVPPATGFDY